MPKMVVIHDVADVDSWLTFKSERVDAVGGMGGSNVVDLVAHDGGNSVAVTAEIDDVDAMVAAIAAPPPELMAVMQRHGVVPPLTLYIEK
jgi:hypothetical protein